MNEKEEKLAIPEMPDSIIEAIDKKGLLIFVGAGLSVLFGYPLWKELGNDLIGECVKRGFMCRSEEAIVCSGDFTPMQEVTIAFNTLKEQLGEDETVQILKSKLSSEKEEKHKDDIARISKYLANYNAPIITTNADNALDNSEGLADRPICRDFKKWDKDLSYDNIIHLHGSIDDPEGMVFTSEQYAKAYTPSSVFGNNLTHLFQIEYSAVLFIGYSVSEFELIRYFLKAKEESKTNFYMLSGYLDKDVIKEQFDKKYMKSLGIEVIPFSMEKNGFESLFDVLEKWNDDVINKTMVHLQVKKTIEKACLNKPNEKSINYIRRMLK